MKIAIVTESLGEHISGGILCIIEILNTLTERGHDCCCFLRHPPYSSYWLKTNFPIYSIKDMNKYDGILVASYSPIAEDVAKASNAEDRFYHVHTIESQFCHNGQRWQDIARRSYDLPLKIFCTSSYLQIIMETIFNRYVIGTLVPPGVDTEVFRPAKEIQHKDRIVIGYLHRPEWVRGLDVMESIVRSINTGPFDVPKHRRTPVAFLPIGHISDRNMMANNYRAMDIYLDMSRLAGSPTPVKEAMACGAISVCTKYGTIDFVLNGHNGYIVPVDDSFFAATTIEGIIMSSIEKRIKLAQNAVDTIKNYTWKDIAIRFEYAIQEGKSRGDELLKKRDWYIQR